VFIRLATQSRNKNFSHLLPFFISHIFSFKFRFET
jgi:hypothetical protein